MGDIMRIDRWFFFFSYSEILADECQLQKDESLACLKKGYPTNRSSFIQFIHLSYQEGFLIIWLPPNYPFKSI